jgi:hypothetical protein
MPYCSTLPPVVRAALAFGVLLVGSACAAPGGSEYAGVQPGLAPLSPLRVQASRLVARPSLVVASGPEAECVPFARTLSGIDIIGDARTWWQQAEGRFARSPRPHAGSVMVFRTHEEMKLGHVAVVTAVLDPRTVLVAHRNWDGGLGKGRTSLDQPVRDVSPRGDWSSVRVWHEGIRALGPNGWALEGFIHPAVPAPRGRVAALVLPPG